MPDTSPSCCHACGYGPLIPVASLGDWPLIASDLQLWRAPVALAYCPACDLLQKPIDKPWQEACDAIYATYQAHKVGGGEEQKLRTPDGRLLPRSLVVLDGLLSVVPLPAVGDMLDFGCGNGTALRSFRILKPEWRLMGHDLGEHQRVDVEAIGPDVAFASGSVADIDRQFDLITLFHSLEHVPDPKRLLADLLVKLKPSGSLLIQVPNVLTQTLDMLIVDHCSHFAPRNVVSIAKDAGFSACRIVGDVAGKEMSIVASRAPDDGPPAGDLPILGIEAARRGLDRLAAIQEEARHLSEVSRPFGLFGTSLFGTWLGESLVGKVDFFVDEDPSRAGRMHLGLPVLAPEAAPPEATVYVSLAGDLPSTIASRLAHLPINWRVPGSVVPAAGL